MAISSNNVQVYTTLSKELVAEIDKDAKENFRTRSQQINMILTTQEISVFSYVFP